MTSSTLAELEVEDVLEQAAAFVRASDLPGAVARAQVARDELVKRTDLGGDPALREELHARIEHRLEEYGRLLDEWQRENAAREAAYVSRERAAIGWEAEPPDRKKHGAAPSPRYELRVGQHKERSRMSEQVYEPERLQYHAAWVGRAFLAMIFVLSGLQKLIHPSIAAAYVASKNIPDPMLAALAAGLFESIVGAFLLFGFQTRWAAVLLAFYLVPVTGIFHSPMGLTGAAAQAQTIEVLKNLAILGGLLIVSAFGAGPVSVDQMRAEHWAPYASRPRRQV